MELYEPDLQDLNGDQLLELEEFENKEETDEDDDPIFPSLQPPFDFDRAGDESFNQALDVPYSASQVSVDYSRASSELLLSDSGDDEITGAGDGHKLIWDEKVRVINQRAVINGVDSKLHSRQLITTHSREELKKRQGIVAALEREKDVICAELMQAVGARNVPATDRLQATQTRIDKELVNERQQMTEEAARLADAEYKLANAELEKGALREMERKLHNNEHVWKSQRENSGKTRRVQQHQLAMNAVRMEQLEQQALAEMVESRSLEERMRLEQIQRARNKHKPFLNHSLAKAKAREYEDQFKQQAHRESRINAVVTLKQNIDANRENIKALNARNAMKSEQAKATETEWVQQVAECQRETALTKERRKRASEEKRQAAVEMQRQREVNIVEKILSEERSLAVRKKQNPHLFIDRIKESYKKPELQPQRRKESRILKALQKPENVTEHPPMSIDYSKFQEQDDVSSDDDDDETNDFDYRSDMKTSRSENLDEPEFAGLWDKQAAVVQRATNTRPPKTTCAISKMEQPFMRSRSRKLNSERTEKRLSDSLSEQDEELETRREVLSGILLRVAINEEIMQERMKKLRESRVVKQVVGGREFKGRPFNARPQVIHFKDFDVGKTYEKRVQLTNVTHTISTCKLSCISEQLRDFISVRFDPPGQISAGITCELCVIFKPMINADLSGAIQFLAHTGPFDVPVMCSVKKCEFQTDTTCVDFGTAVIGETLRRTVVLSNCGACGTTFQFGKLSCLNNDANSVEEQSVASQLSLASVSPAKNINANGDDIKITVVDSPLVIDQSPSASEAPEITVSSTDCLVETIYVTNNLPAVDVESQMMIPDEMTTGHVTYGEIGPHSTVKLEIVWLPTTPGPLSTDFVVKFADPNSNDIVIRAVSNAVDVPVWVERANVDLKICTYDRLYQDTVVIHNRANTALKLKFDVPKELRNHFEILPHTGFIQSQSQCSAQLKFLPRSSLCTDATKYFDPETGVLEAVINVIVANQTLPVPFSIHAVVTTSDLQFDSSCVDFGYCTIHEAVTYTVELTNHSILPQQFGFVGIPEFVDIQPGDGFGTILPKESIKLDVIFQPRQAGNYNFELVCKTLINREFRLTCCGIGVLPPLELSHQVVCFAPTSLNDIAVATITVINNHLDKHEYRHPVPRIGTGEIADVGPTSFEFRVPEDAPLTVSPSVGTLSPGMKTKVTVQFMPVLSDADICLEAVRLITIDLERKAQEQRKAELEKEQLLEQQQSQQKLKKSSPSKSKVSSIKLSKSGDNEQSSESKSLVDITPPSVESIVKNSPEYFAGQASLIRTFQSKLSSYKIPCYIASGHATVDPSSPPKYCVQNTLYVEAVCPIVRPDIVVVSNNGQNSTNFGDVAVCHRVVKSVVIQNISDCPIELHTSCLSTSGPFSIINATRTLAPEAVHTMHIGFQPHRIQRFQETLRIHCSTSSAIYHTVKGAGVSPVVTLSVDDGLLDFGHILAGDYKEYPFTITNTSGLQVEYQLRLGSDPIHLSERTQLTDYYHRQDHHVESVIGTQNNSGQQVFDCVPLKGVIEPGSLKEIIATFSPDHSSLNYSDICYVDLFAQKESYCFRLRGRATDHSMYVRGGDSLNSEVESLSALHSDQDEDLTAVVPVLVTLHCSATDTGYSTSSREISIGCVQAPHVASSKKAGGGKQGGSGGKQAVEWTFDNVQPLSAFGFSIDPVKGNADAGTERPVTISWTPPTSGSNVNSVVSANINCVIKGDVTLTYQFLLRGFINVV